MAETATDKQIAFLKKLGVDYVDFKKLTKAQASELIDNRKGELELYDDYPRGYD